MKLYFKVGHCKVETEYIEELLDKYDIDYKLKEIDDGYFKLKLENKCDYDFVLNLFKQLGIVLDFNK